MSADIYYFSGTGNSLYVAKELQKRLPQSNLIPIVSLLEEKTIKITAETIGFIFPNFCLTIPIPFMDFLKKLDATSADYIFAICTRGGTPSEAFECINKFLKRQQKKLNAHLNINMPWNHPLGKENLPSTATKEEIERLDVIMQKKLDSFSKSIMSKTADTKEDTDVSRKLSPTMTVFNLLIPKSVTYKLHKYMYGSVIEFYSDSKCTSCGTCEQVCLANKIKMENDKPLWQKDVKCYGCFACINYCPQQAIQIQSKFPVKSSTEVNARYHHPEITFKDIAKQKNSQ